MHHLLDKHNGIVKSLDNFGELVCGNIEGNAPLAAAEEHIMWGSNRHN